MNKMNNTKYNFKNELSIDPPSYLFIGLVYLKHINKVYVWIPYQKYFVIAWVLLTVPILIPSFSSDQTANFTDFLEQISFFDTLIF